MIHGCSAPGFPGIPGLPATGLATVPAINVLGAYFPDWMFCLVGALVVMGLVHLALAAAGWTRTASRWLWLGVYPLLGLVVALGGWLAFFQD